MRLPIVRPHFPEFDSELSAMFADCLRGGQVTNGEYVKIFEENLEHYLGAPALAFCNGQTALTAMLLAAGVAPDDEVVLPSFTFCGTPHAVSMIGAVPRFAEINPETLTMDCADAAEQAGERAVAILGVDVYGICCDYARLRAATDVPLLFDSAPAFGSRIEGRLGVEGGLTQIYSFHATKPFSTMEGGALVSINPGIIEGARRIREFGQDKDRRCIDIGLNGKMTEICAIIGIEQLRTFETRRQHRRSSSLVFRSKLSTIPHIKTINDPPGQQPIWTYMPVLAATNELRDSLLARLHHHGIEARIYYTACHKLLPLYDTGLKLPVTEAVAARVIALPLYDEMTAEEMDYICEVLS